MSDGKVKEYPGKKRAWPVVLLFVCLAAAAAAAVCYFMFSDPQESALPADSSVSVRFAVDDAVGQALERLSAGAQRPEMVTQSNDTQFKVRLLIYGMPSGEMADGMLTLLDRHGMEATFFLPAGEAAEDEDTARAIAKRQPVGSGSLNSAPRMETLSAEELTRDFAMSRAVLNSVLGEAPGQLSCNATKYTGAVLDAAGAGSYTQVVQAGATVNSKSFSNESQALAFVNQLPHGAILSFKIGALEASEYPAVSSPVSDDSLTNQKKTAESRTESIGTENPGKEQEALRVFGWLLNSIANANYQGRYEEIRAANQEKQAPLIRNIHTTERAVVYQFCGLNDGPEMQHLLDTLAQLHAVGTFYATRTELEQYPELVKQLLDAGHELGIAVRPAMENFDFYLAFNELLRARELLQSQYGYSANWAFQQWGEPSALLAEAASAAGMELAGYDYGIFDESLMAETNPRRIISNLMETVTGLKRGQILFFPLNYYDRSEMVGDLVRMITAGKTQYSIRSLSAVWHNEKYRYQYPVPDSGILREVKNRIFPGQLAQSPLDFMQLVEGRYVGNPDSGPAKLPGFTEDEMERIDRTGQIKNINNTVFLSFDDWGGDITIDNILAVMRKHGVKGTFFVRSNHVNGNPNLLRAIALEGHDIASHTHEHTVLANHAEGSAEYTALTAQEAYNLRLDLTQSYQTLQSIVGDVAAGGKPALTTLFRPPTLAVSRPGMEAVFDCGYTYVVAGDFTTHDYKAANVQEIMNQLIEGIRPDDMPDGPILRTLSGGSIVILHMSDNSRFTSQALDIFLTQNEQKAEGDSSKFTFAKLSTYLDGTYTNPTEETVN